MRRRTLRQHRPRDLGDRLRHLGARLRLVGRVTRRRTSACRARARARHHLLRHRRRLRPGRQRGDRRHALCAPGAPRDGSSSRPSSATCSTPSARSTRRASARTTGRRSTPGGRSRRACGGCGTDYVDLYQLHNPRMDAIEARRALRELEALRDRGQDPPLRDRARARRSAGATRACGRSRSARPRLPADRLQPARAGPGRRLPRAAERARRRRDRPRPDLLAACSRPTHARDRPSRARPPPPPAAEWLVEGLQKVDRLASSARRRAHDGPGRATSTSSPSRRSPASCTPSTTPRSSRSGPRRARTRCPT